MDILKEQARRFFASAEKIHPSDPTGATILYFKSLFVLLDAVILEKTGKSPKDHTERFQILKQRFSEYYLLLDKYYQLYRDTYTAVISAEQCNEVRNAVKELLEKHAKD